MALNCHNRETLTDTVTAFQQVPQMDIRRKVKKYVECEPSKDKETVVTCPEVKIARNYVSGEREIKIKVHSDGQIMGHTDKKDEKSFDLLFRSFAKEGGVTNRSFDKNVTIVDQSTSTSCFYRFVFHFVLRFIVLPFLLITLTDSYLEVSSLRGDGSVVTLSEKL